MSATYRPLLLATCLFALALLVAGIAPPPVAAHAFLQRTAPANGAIVAANVGEVRLTFNERVEVRPERIAVIGSDGRRYDLRDAQAVPGDPLAVAVSLPQLPNGVFTVRYALLSSDTHPITGSFRFGVGVTPGEVLDGTVATQETGLTTAVLLQSLGRWLNLLGLTLLFGPIIFRFFALVPFRWRGGLAPPTAATRLFEARAVRWVWVGVTVLIVGQVVALIATSVGNSIGTFAEALQPNAVLANLNGRFGTLWLARLALLLVPALALPVLAAEHELRAVETVDEADQAAPPRPPRPTRGGGWWAILGAGVALALLTSLGGHPAATNPVPLSVLVDWLHLLATIVWVGGLLALGFILPGIVRALAPEEGASTLAATATRFSALAVGSIQVLVVTGFYQTWAHIDAPAQLGSTSYGRALAAKLLLIVPLLALGAFSRFVITPRLRALAAAIPTASGQPAPTRRLWRTVWGEAALATVVLAVVGILTALPPASVTATGQGAENGGTTGASPVGVTLGGAAGSVLVNLTIGPTTTGPAVVAVTLRDPQGTTIEDAAVTLRAIPPDGGAPATVALDARGGRYTGLVELGRVGAWKFEALVTPPGGSPATATFAISLPSGGAMALLAEADAAMNTLTSLRERQSLGAGGTPITTVYEWSAPDKLRSTSDVGGAMIVVGTRRFDRSGNGQWLESTWPEPAGYRWPQYVFTKTSTDVTLLGQERIDGVLCWVIGVADATATDARLTIWIGVDDKLVRQQRMFAVGHYMESRFYDFNVPITITAP